MSANTLPLPQYLVISPSDPLPYFILILSYYPLSEWVNRCTGRSICRGLRITSLDCQREHMTELIVSILFTLYTNHILHWSNQMRHYVGLPSLSCDLLQYTSLSNILIYQVDLFVKCVGIRVMGLLTPDQSSGWEADVQNIVHNYPSAIIEGEIAGLLD